MTGRKSYTRLEQVLELQHAAADRDASGVARRAAVRALVEIDIHGKVSGPYQRFRAAQEAIGIAARSTDDGSPQDQYEHGVAKSEDPTETIQSSAARDARRERNRVRAFLLVLNRLSGWTTDHDPCVLGPALGQEQWADLRTVITATVEFVDAAQQARDTRLPLPTTTAATAPTPH